jgi:type I restriction enzyme S subunit
MEMMPGYKQTEVGVIPDHWEVVRLDDAVDFLDGRRRPVKDTDRSKMRGEIPYYGASGIVDYVNDYLFDDELILLGEDGENILSRNCRLVFRVSGKTWVNNHAHVLKPKLSYDIGYLTDYLESLDYGQYNTGTAQPKLNKQVCSGIPVLRPPLQEQRSIAAALSDVDALLAKLDQLIAKKRDLKQAAMQQLLTGQTRLPGFSGEWEVKRLGEVADLLKGGGLSKDSVAASGRRKCILYGELFTTYGQVILDVIGRTNSQDGRQSVAGDVLVPGSTTTDGIDLATASALLEDGVALGGDINIIRNRNAEVFDPRFLANYLTHVKKREIAERAQGTTIVHLYGRDLSDLSVQRPDLAEQVAIATVLSDMDAEIAALQARRDKTRDLKQGMMQELLTGRIRLV